MRAAVLAAVVVLSGVAAIVWFSSQGISPSAPRTDPSPSIGRTTEVLPPSSSSTRLMTSTPAPAPARTCLDSPESLGAAGGTSPEGFPGIAFDVSPRISQEGLVRIAQAASDARQAFDVQKGVTEGRVAYTFRGELWLSLSRGRSSRSGLEHPLWLIERSARFFENAVVPRDLENFRRTQIRRWDVPTGAPAVAAGCSRGSSVQLTLLEQVKCTRGGRSTVE